MPPFLVVSCCILGFMEKTGQEESGGIMRVDDLLAGVGFETVLGDAARTRIRDLVYDSRKAKPQALFVGLSPIGEGGADGSDFAADAWDAGVRAFLLTHLPDALSERIAAASEAPGASPPFVAITEDTRRALALASGNFFGHPSEALKLVAITGTKGKTSAAFMMKSVFEAAGKKTGVIGTNGILYGDVWDVLPNTTPESYTINAVLRDMVSSGVEYCFLEASSQGFFLHRTDGLRFDAAVFTNIAPDHISKTEHPDFAHYLACKKRIFEQTGICFINRDSDHYDEIIDGAPCPILTYGFADAGHGADYQAKNITPGTGKDALSVRFRCSAPGWEEDILIPMAGVFNVSNALAAICVADHYNISKETIAEGLSAASVKGRMDLVRAPAPYTVLIDYAHNRLSMENLFEAVEACRPKRILCVFGLIGNRAKGRRFECGEILGARADYTILANNSPGTDDPLQILADIATGIERGGGTGRYEIIPDRREAIRKILSLAREGDLVILAGKGDGPHEEANGVVTPFSERAVVEEYFGE